MTDPSSSSRFKAEMPNIPGVSTHPVRRNPLLPLIVGLFVLGVVLLVALHWVSRASKSSEPAAVEPAPQIEVPPPPPDPSTSLPHADETHPVIADLADLSKPWSSADFFLRNKLTGENIPATIIRLPGGSATAPSSYWAFSRRAPYGDCQLEYVTDLEKLRSDYDYHHANHPLVGNPCSRTLFDPLRTSSLPGNVWVRGAIVQGSDIRPPLGIEIQIQGKEILAVRSE